MKMNTLADYYYLSITIIWVFYILISVALATLAFPLYKILGKKDFITYIDIVVSKVWTHTFGKCPKLHW